MLLFLALYNNNVFLWHLDESVEIYIFSLLADDRAPLQRVLSDSCVSANNFCACRFMFRLEIVGTFEAST